MYKAVVCRERGGDYAHRNRVFVGSMSKAMHRARGRMLGTTPGVRKTPCLLRSNPSPPAPGFHALTVPANSCLRWSTMTAVLLRLRSSTNGLTRCRPRSTTLPTARDLMARKGRPLRCTASRGWDVRRFWLRLLSSSTER